MTTRRPSLRDIEELVAFRPLLSAAGFTPFKTRATRVEAEDRSPAGHWPEYEDVVVRFFQVAAQECWSDFDYRPEDAGRMLGDHDLVREADVDQLRTMLTYCVRGERFCDGHWGAMIEAGHVARLLDRLAELGSAERDHRGGDDG